MSVRLRVFLGSAVALEVAGWVGWAGLIVGWWQ